MPSNLFRLLSGTGDTMPSGLNAFQQPPHDISYNTPLSPVQQQGYNRAAIGLRNTLGRDVRQDERDYDMRGAYRAGLMNPSGNMHFPDQFKKPWHPTFSTESQYSFEPGMQAGKWSQSPLGQDIFTAGRTNLNYMRPYQLRSYFNRVEPNAQLNIPQFPYMQIPNFPNVLR